MFSLVFITPVISSMAVAQDDYLCPKVDLWSKLLQNIPFNEMLPVTIGGAQFGGGNGKVPSNAVTSAVCSCDNALGIQEFGVSVGYWEVAFLVELVRKAGCFPVLNTTINIDKSSTQNLGGSHLGGYGGADLAFYHAHVYSFPLFKMLNLMSDLSCGEDDYFDLDLLYMSELDPAWSNELLSLQNTPELQSLANAKVIESCQIDAQHAYNGTCSDKANYCAGAWGFLYPLSGFTASAGVARDTSLLAARIMTLLHRRGLIRQTAGQEAMCGSVYQTFPVKSAYRFSLLYPLAEKSSTHAWGEPVEWWQGDSRIPPGFSDVVYVVWRYKNCCLRVD